MIDATEKQWLREKFGECVRFDEAMAKHTSFKIGGPADVFIQPEKEQTLKAVLKWSQRKEIPYLLIGGGTNILVRDGGIRGLVIHLGRLEVETRWESSKGQVRVTAPAGIPTKRVCVMAMKQGWLGMNFALGIPGTLGGAIMMNAGTAHGAMADIVESVSVMNTTGDKMDIARDSMDYAYRRLRLPHVQGTRPSAPPILISAVLVLDKADCGQVRRQARIWMRSRAKQQPAWQPSAGCFFKNPQKHLPAGRLIDEAGLKGWQAGAAQVSHSHANFIVNLGGARATDVIAVKDKIQKRVKSRFGINLEPEVLIVGEEENSAQESL